MTPLGWLGHKTSTQTNSCSQMVPIKTKDNINTFLLLQIHAKSSKTILWKKIKLSNELCRIKILFCVEVLRPSQPNGVMSSAVSLPNHTFTGQAKSSKGLISIVHILSPETDNYPSWISGRERITVENISYQSPRKNVADLGVGWTRDLLVFSRTAHPTEPPRPAAELR